MSEGLISIIIPVYNKTQHLREVLLSLQKQTFSHLEVIIVDDGSDIPVSEQSTMLSVLWLRQDHKGAPAARNFGFSQSRGSFVLFLDADTVCAPEMIEKLYEGLQKNPGASYAYCDYYRGVKRFPARHFDGETLKKNNYINTSSLIRRKDFFGFDESLQRFQDWDLWIGLLEKGKVGAYVPGFFYRTHMSRGGMSTWLPSFAYKFPFRYLPFFSTRVKSYESAKKVVQKKYHLETED